MTQADSKRFEAAQYALRASFYYRASARWTNLLELPQAVTDPGEWQPLSYYGISEQAAQRVRELGLPFTNVFAHPKVLAERPRSIGYYRGLALLPQKGMQRLAFGTQSLEDGRGSLSLERAVWLTTVLNGLICLQLESDPEWTIDKALTAAMLNLGSQINGSWRNTIGEEGNRQIKVLLSSLLTEENLVDSFMIGDSTVTPPVAAEDAVRIREIRLTNGFIIRFGSEPDVSVISPTSLLAGTIEVKYGSDPAGALERYGAAKKSFEAAVRQHPRVQNVYLANVITEEVRRRIGEDRLVSEVFEFSRLTVDQAERQRLFRFITRRMLDL